MFRMIFFVVGEVMARIPDRERRLFRLPLSLRFLDCASLVAEMHAFWATHFFLGFFLMYTGYKAGDAFLHVCVCFCACARKSPLFLL